jgi:transcriptional regulator with XRE-family HTH domain
MKRIKKKAGLNGGAHKLKTIGQMIKAARVKKGLKAEQVAEACNVSRARVYMWETQEHIMAKNLNALSTILDIPLARLEKVNGPPPIFRK